MSTGKSNTTLKRFAELAKMGELVFHTKDLSNLWQIENPNTLHTTLTRYAKQKLLFRIFRGFYSLKPVEQINPLLLGVKALHTYAYVSGETVLAKSGIIQQNVSQITLISSKSKKFSIGDNQYYSRKLSDRFLYNPTGIIKQDGINTATTERAVADLLYFNPKYYFDAAYLIDWEKVKDIQKRIGYPLTPQHYDFTQPKRR